MICSSDRWYCPAPYFALRSPSCSPHKNRNPPSRKSPHTTGASATSSWRGRTPPKRSGDGAAWKNFSAEAEDAKDVFQEALLVFYEQRQSGQLADFSGNIKTYLFAIGKNLLLTRLRKSRMIGNHSERYAIHVNGQHTPDAQERMERDDDLSKVRFPGLLFKHGMSGHAEQRVLIQFDIEPQRYAYEPELRTRSKFGIAMSVPCCSLSLLLAQKCLTILQRPRNKGRDFYDVVFLLSRNIAPDMGYITQRTGLESQRAMAQALLDHCAKLDMNAQAEDVRQFVIDAETLETVVQFKEIIRQRWLG
jgi:hypothetical protein